MTEQNISGSALSRNTGDCCTVRLAIAAYLVVLAVPLAVPLAVLAVSLVVLAVSLAVLAVVLPALVVAALNWEGSQE